MNRDKKESDFPAKQELPSSDHEKQKASSSSAQWLRLKDPRIVRVSRAFGGKDRHSKVCTTRGLRDRRVRLSVPTAIQLYDLQDRLGLNQPSKVVDWLLNAAKNEIDELPPLPIPPGNFSLSPLPSVLSTSNEVTAASQLNINGGFHWDGNNFWKSKCKEVSGEIVSEKKSWTDRSGEEKQESNEVLPNNNFLPGTSHPSLLGLLNAVPLGTNFQWEHSGEVSHPTGSHGFTSQIADLNGINVVPFPSTLSLSTGNKNNNNSQILACPPGATQPYFPSHGTAMEIFDPRQINQQHQMLNSGSQNLLTNSLGSLYSNSHSVKPFSLSMNMMTPKLLHSPNRSDRQSHKDHQDFPPK